MSAYQFVNPAPLFFNIPGTAPLGTGGNLYFYDEETTNPRDTWSYPALDVPSLNPNPVPLDASGRSTVAIWLDGNYTVELRDSLGDLVWSRPVRSDVTAGLSIPALVADYILSNDGSNLAWVDPIGALFPDPSGSSGYVLGTDGVSIFWTPQQEIPEPVTPDIEIGTVSLTLGDGGSDKFLIQCGSDQLPASGNYFSQKTLTFPVPFAKILGISVTLNTTVVGVQTGIPAFAVTGWTLGSASTSVTVYGRNIPVGEHDDSNDYITQVVPYSWVAFGLIAATP